MEIFRLKNAQDMPSAPLPMWVFCHVSLQTAHTKQLYGHIKLPLHLQSYEVLSESVTGKKVMHNSSFFLYKFLCGRFGNLCTSRLKGRKTGLRMQLKQCRRMDMVVGSLPNVTSP